MAKKNKGQQKPKPTKKQPPAKIEKKKPKRLKKKKLDKTLPLPTQTYNDSDSESESEKIQNLLEPYTKDQLIDFIIDAAVKDPDLLSRIHSAADADVSHRKIFVYGLGWDTTRETLSSTFRPFGEIEDCTVVLDRITGKSKGFGFVLFKSRQGALKALKQPKKKINNRMTSCQLASVGPAPPPQNQDTSGRKIYVSNVHADVDPEKLRAFFAKFGEIETGPIGFDMQTGKSRGFALFVYKTLDGARKVLQEPYKLFEGHQLHCRQATEGKNKVSAVTTAVQPVQPVQPPVLAAMAAAQNLALFGQNPSLYGGFYMNPNAGYLGAGQVGYGAMGLGGLGGSQSVLGAYGSGGQTVQGMQYAGYPQIEQGGAAVAGRTPGATGSSFSGYQSHI